tara:strand:- start:196 stop:498 length:303 start_codon:yes stop_codon:yes gene_type:complete
MYQTREMKKLSDDVLYSILQYLPNSSLTPWNKYIARLVTTNVVWKPRVEMRFRTMPSTNYYEEYRWQLKLETHKFVYKRQWTLGCVGRVIPLEKPSAAIK